MAAWTTAFINNLPDSSFAYIEGGGTKDSDGKTTPRSLRHLPYKDASGKVDASHTRNALARLNQTDAVPSSKRAEIQTMLQNALKKANGGSQNSTDDLVDALKEKSWLSAVKVELDATGVLPTRFALLHTGTWDKSVKGDFSVDIDDLQQIKRNFDAGIGFPTEDASTGLAIDLAHDYAHEAAGWIKGLELAVDPNDNTKGTLYANPVEWTDVGTHAIQTGQYKCVSPMGYFGRKAGKLSMWANPTNLSEKVANVIEGAGLTNIPFLRGMAPIRADKLEEKDLQNANAMIICVYDQQTKEESDMNLDALRVKEREALSVPELDYLTEHKSELSADELGKFKLEATSTEPKDQTSDEDKALLAAIKAGDKKVIEAKEEPVDKTRLDSLEATAKQYREEKATAIVADHVKRGAIKHDKAEDWTKRLLDAVGETERKAMEEMLADLPSNDLLAKENGSNAKGTGEDVPAGSTAREQLDALAKAKVAAAAKEGKELLYTDALKQVTRENADLLNQDRQEQLTKAGA